VTRLAPLLLFAFATAQAQPAPAELRAVFTDRFHFSEDEIAKIESGQAVAKMLPADKPDDLRLAGVVMIRVSSDDFIRAYKDIVRFESSKEVRRTGKFSNPPVAADLNGFQLADLDPHDLRACRPGKCSYKMPAALMQRVQKTINWNAPDAQAQIEALLREVWINYLNRYREKGDSALAVYYDTPQPFSVAEGLEDIINGLPFLASRLPDLTRYVKQYPNDRPPETEDFFYWQEADFGLKPVVRTSHVILQKLPRPGSAYPHYAIAAKMLFATHYFRAAVEFKYIYPVVTASGTPAIYFITYQRSFVDGMTGVTGTILRRITPSRSQASLVENLGFAKTQLERQFSAR
jgi:hypothetical protein